MLLRRWMWIAWPAFLAAGVMEMLVFAVVDPLEMQWLSAYGEVSRLGVCTVAFFLFWAIIMMASAMTSLLALSPQELNARSAASVAISGLCEVGEESSSLCGQARAMPNTGMPWCGKAGRHEKASGRRLGAGSAPRWRGAYSQACWLLTMRLRPRCPGCAHGAASLRPGLPRQTSRRCG
jgi:hypothetical protein